MQIILPYNPSWKTCFTREAKSITSVLADYSVDLHHIGSTAIAGIHAKPIIDILGGASSLDAIDQGGAALGRLGYEALGEHGIKGRRYFRKFDSDGRRSHHLHIFEAGSSHIERHLAFRDYLNAHPIKAAEYSTLKRDLIERQRLSWNGYQDAKAPFICALEPIALNWYRRQYTQRLTPRG